MGNRRGRVLSENRNGTESAEDVYGVAAVLATVSDFILRGAAIVLILLLLVLLSLLLSSLLFLLLLVLLLLFPGSNYVWTLPKYSE